MSEILSQAEIDELLNALTAGSDPEPEKNDNDFLKARSYDFKTANRIPKEQMRTLNIVFQTFGQLFSNRLSTILRTSCECEVLTVEEMSFNEFNNSLPSPVVLAITNMPPLAGSQIVEISNEVGYMLISRLLGGSGGDVDNNKPFTEIEVAIIERVLRQVIHVFGDAWEKVLDVRAHLDRLETSSQFTQIVALNEVAAVIALNLKVGGESGIVTICIPHSSIEPVSKQLSTRLWYSGGAQQEAGRNTIQTDRISGKLVHTEVTMTAYFEETPATVIDIVNLQVGDVIRLSQKMNDPIMVKVQHIPKFLAKVGTSGSQYAVQIVDIIKEENGDESFARRN